MIQITQERLYLRTFAATFSLLRHSYCATMIGVTYVYIQQHMNGPLTNVLKQFLEANLSSFLAVHYDVRLQAVEAHVPHAVGLILLLVTGKGDRKFKMAVSRLICALEQK